MNCAECRDNLVACLEGLLEPEQSRACQAHLETCAACRAEYAAINRLQQRLVAGGRLAAEVAMVEPVMRRVRQTQDKPERNTIMSRLLKHRWGFGLGAAASAAAIILVVALAAPRAQAKAAEVLAKGAQALARLTSVHLRGELRTQPQDNFSYIDPDCQFYAIELWKQFEPNVQWRAEKPGRVAVMDGHSTLLYIKSANLAFKLPQPASSAFDTEWLHRIANLSNAITNELNNALAKGWKLGLTEERGTDGRPKAVVTVEASANVPDNDYLKNKFLDTSDTRRVYRFDTQTELLEGVQVYVHRRFGDVLIFEVQQIEYNQPLAPEVFQVKLPADVNWYQEPQKLPDNEKYAAMTAEQAAQAFFEACGRADWTEVAKFCPFMPLNDQMRQYLGGMELVSLGQSFTSQGYPGQFVPYEIKFKTGEAKKMNLALKKDPKVGRWFVDGGF
jgi:hypothetical protein